MTSEITAVPLGLVVGGADGEIEIFPVNFIVDHGSIVFKTAAGTKLSLARAACPT